MNRRANRRVLRFFINGICQPVSYSNIPEYLRFYVYIFYVGNILYQNNCIINFVEKERTKPLKQFFKFLSFSFLKFCCRRAGNEVEFFSLNKLLHSTKPGIVCIHIYLYI
jgi:hypothetical protein